jgi:hypothetical protein
MHENRIDARDGQLMLDATLGCLHPGQIRRNIAQAIWQQRGKPLPKSKVSSSRSRRG